MTCASESYLAVCCVFGSVRLSLLLFSHVCVVSLFTGRTNHPTGPTVPIATFVLLDTTIIVFGWVPASERKTTNNSCASICAGCSTSFMPLRGSLFWDPLFFENTMPPRKRMSSSSSLVTNIERMKDTLVRKKKGDFSETVWKPPGPRGLAL